jgi:quercetin dioxygenase-like cupin family protein
MASADLNATLIAWPAGFQVAAHVNAERDVLVVVLDGSAAVTLDGVEHEIGPHELLLIERGRERALTAGPTGVRYLSIHLRREPLLPSRRQSR